jgi:hypothetical protein
MWVSFNSSKKPHGELHILHSPGKLPISSHTSRADIPSLSHKVHHRGLDNNITGERLLLEEFESLNDVVGGEGWNAGLEEVGQVRSGAMLEEWHEEDLAKCAEVVHGHDEVSFVHEVLHVEAEESALDGDYESHGQLEGLDVRLWHLHDTSFGFLELAAERSRKEW